LRHQQNLYEAGVVDNVLRLSELVLEMRIVRHTRDTSQSWILIHISLSLLVRVVCLFILTFSVWELLRNVRIVDQPSFLALLSLQI
jgi:hypothetical protein